MTSSTESSKHHGTHAEPLQALLEASAMLLADVSAESVVSGIVGLARQLIEADAYAVWRTRDGLNWKVIASSGLSPSYRTTLKAATVIAPTLMAVEDVTTHPYLSHLQETYREESICSMLVVPLQFHNGIPVGPNGGTITFYWRTPHTFAPTDVPYATALGNLSSAALNLAELHEQNVREKNRLAFLAEASEVLASSLDYEATLEHVANIAVPSIADWCTVHILENGTPNRIVVAHADPEMLEFSRQYGRKFPEVIREDRGLGLVLRTGRAEMIEAITDEMLAAAIHDPEQLSMLRYLRLRASIIVPLVARGRVLGAIRLLAAGGDRTFSKDDLQLAEDLARRAAAVIENAQLHRTLVANADQLRLALTAARVGTWTWDLIRHQPAWSEEWKALYGLPPETEASEQLGIELLHPDDRDKVLSQVKAVTESDADQLVIEHRSRHATGRIFWMHTRARVERDEFGKAVMLVGLSMDVTERRQSEEALRRSDRLATAGRLAATVAHEINNPLESIVNLVYLARAADHLPAPAARYLASADEELTRIAQTVRQTLGFYRESVSPRITDISRLVADTLAAYRPRIEAAELTTQTDLQPGLSALIVPGELKQVLANLLTNAVEASSPGGRLSLVVRRDGDSVLFSISDTGSGIAEIDLPRLFEPFFTTKADIGTGLGLWVTKGIIEKHEGEITISTSTRSDDHGTTMTVRLPLAT